MSRARPVAWFLSLALALCGALACSLLPESINSLPWLRVWAFVVMGVAGIGSVLLFPDWRTGTAAVSAIWIPAIVLRIALFPAPFSDDVNRYVWEGGLVASGQNPYSETADAGKWVDFRDGYWEAMNHKDKPTNYPPLSQLAFAVAGSVWYNPLPFKLLFVLADLATLAGVLALLRQRKLPARWSGFYALSPVVLVAYAGEAHFDSLMVAPFVWALWALENRKHTLCAGLAALSVGAKVMTLPLVPFLLWTRSRREWLVFAAVLVLPALPFLLSLAGFANAFVEFGSTRSFNGPVFDILRFRFEFGRSVCNAIVLACFAVVFLWRMAIRERAPVESHLRWVLGALLVFSPTVHFWYIAWILPLVCLRPSMPWVLVSVSSAMYFLVWSHEYWGLLERELQILWGPFVLALAYELWSTRARFLRKTPRERNDPSVSVVIPTLNAGAHIKACLDSLKDQSSVADEVIIVDGGSEDDTVDRAKATFPGIRIVPSKAGRGQQIRKGIETCTSEWVLVIHADGIVVPDAIERMVRSVTLDQRIIGGAIGQRFDRPDAFNVMLEVLNDLRSTFTNTYFGDQGQFFHRETALKHDLMPAQALMEDVESSWRTRERGETLYLGGGLVASAEKWSGSGRLRRLAGILRMLMQYRIARLFGRKKAAKLSERLYEEYYRTS